ncbi:hypothetical protein CS542_02400 [Pedobacter sp. IW39]|nr:hypothetical protein CS542_02400 [Pedobacter sp. IW39]
MFSKTDGILLYWMVIIKILHSMNSSSNGWKTSWNNCPGYTGFIDVALPGINSNQYLGRRTAW